MEIDSATYDDILESLEGVIDPELGVDIVALGLVYEVSYAENGDLDLRMTLTSPGCPLTEVITEEVNAVLSWLDRPINIEWVWSPAWHSSNITASGREQLRALGLSI